MNNVLHQRSDTSDILVDMLRELGEPTYLALALSDAEKALLERAERMKELPPQTQARILDNLERSIAGEIALLREDDD